MVRNYRICMACMLVSFIIFASGNDAGAVQIPSTAEPGVLSRSLEEQQTKQPPSTKDVLVIQKSREEEKAQSEEKAFKLENVILENSTVYDKEAVNQAVQKFIGKQTSFADLNAIGALLTAKYRNDGYIFSRVIVPPQKIKDGTVRLSAIEGHVTDIKIVGDYKDDNNLIKNMAENIKLSVPANEKDVERYLLLIDDLPGIRARSVMSPSETPGGGELTIAIEQDDLEGAVGIDNYGSRNLGPFQLTGVGAGNSLFGIHDRTTLRVISSTDMNELMYGEIIHEEQLGTEGANIKFRYSRTRTRPGDNLESFDIKGTSDNFDIEAKYPLLRSRRSNVNLLGGFNSLGSRTDMLDTKITEDRVRSIRVQGHGDFMDSWAGINQIEAKIVKGLPIFDATQDGAGRTNINGKHDFLRTNLSFVRVQDIWDKFSLQLSGSGQYSHDPLLISEQFLIGGREFGRAYDSGELTGDQGIAGSAELRYGEATDNPYVKSYQFYTYYDQGRVWNVKTVVGGVKSDALSSVGVGMRLNLGYDIYGALEVNKPLTREVSAEGDKDPRVFFNILKRF